MGNGHNLHLPKPPRIGPILLAILVVSGLAEMAYGIVNFSAMPVYIKAIGLDARWIGTVAAAYLVAEGLLKSPFGILGDRVGRKSLMLIGPFTSIFTALLTPHFHNPYFLMLLRGLDGVGLAALWPSAFSMIGDYVPANRRASAMSLFNVAYLVGIALGPVIGGAVNDAAHNYFSIPNPEAKQASFYAAAILFTITVLVGILALPGGKVVHGEPGESLHAGGTSLNDFTQMLRRMPALLGIAFFAFLGIGCIMAYAKIFVMEFFGLSETQFGALLLGPALAIALASVPLGTIGDRIGKPAAAKIGIGICALSFTLLLVLASKAALIICGSTIGIGFVIAFPALMAQVSEVCDSHQRGAAVGAVGTAQGLGAILGVLASGTLYKLPITQIAGFAIPLHSIPFLCCAVMLLIAFSITLFGLKSSPALPCKS